MNSIRLFKTLGWSLLLLMVISAYAASQKQEAPLTRFEYERPEMGVAFRIVLYAADQSTADRAADAAFRRIQELNDIMSDYEPDSELSRLSRSSGQGREVRVSNDLWFVLQRSQALAEKSEGA